MFSFSLFKCNKCKTNKRVSKKSRKSRKSRKPRRVRMHKGGNCPPGVDTDACKTGGKVEEDESFVSMVGGKRRLSRKFKGGEPCVGAVCKEEDESFVSMVGGKRKSNLKKLTKKNNNYRK
jgi:hypothetical protein